MSLLAEKALLLKATNLSTPIDVVDSKCKEKLVVMPFAFTIFLRRSHTVRHIWEQSIYRSHGFGLMTKFTTVIRRWQLVIGLYVDVIKSFYTVTNLNASLLTGQYTVTCRHYAGGCHCSGAQSDQAYFTGPTVIPTSWHYYLHRRRLCF